MQQREQLPTTQQNKRATFPLVTVTLGHDGEHLPQLQEQVASIPTVPTLRAMYRHMTKDCHLTRRGSTVQGTCKEKLRINWSWLQVEYFFVSWGYFYRQLGSCKLATTSCFQSTLWWCQVKLTRRCGYGVDWRAQGSGSRILMETKCKYTHVLCDVSTL